MTKYSLGFAFYKDKVILIKKNKPTWQAGKLNGVGGKVEEGESFLMAMVREFKEETNIQTIADDWHILEFINEPDHRMMVFWTRLNDISDLKSLTDEPVDIYNVIQLGWYPLITNLHDFIPRAFAQSWSGTYGDY